ncbi:coiled-coil domain-containing protein 18 isoform X2 [Nelusetta ayraudi]|uniref:coiled-coil domain-containing protein 18 isoform X2 n=1 Tax=Nelusetta ayraudi TaxID=303726 RepID=UPI003F720B5D
MESFSSKKRAGCVRQENACLTLQDEQLIRDFDAVQYELPSFGSQGGQRKPRAGVINSSGQVAVMSEQISLLEAELEAQAEELKAVQLRAECSQEAAVHSDIVVENLTVELNTLRQELDAKIVLCKRAEQQRNQALQNAEGLKEAFKDYKATRSAKYQKVIESENKLKENLIECARLKEGLEMKCDMLESENVGHKQIISQAMEELQQAKSTATGLRAQLVDMEKQNLLLEAQLKEQGAKCREVASLRRQLEDQRALTQSHEQTTAQRHRECQQSQGELESLQAILSLLHLREGSGGSLCIRPCLLPHADYSGTPHLLNLKPGEGYQHLLRVLQSMEAERSKHSGLAERLQERLSRAQEEISSLQSSIAQKASQYQNLHTELLGKASQATDTEKELKRKSARVASLEKQLQEKSSAYSQAALTNTELQNHLQEKNSTIQHYQSLMAKKQKEYQQSLEKSKTSQTEQQHSLEMLQLSLDEAQFRVLEMEQELKLFHRQRDEAQNAAALLQNSVDQLSQKQDELRHREELLQTFREQAEQSASKVQELQSSLSECREELNVYLQQMEEVKKNYESELQKKNEMTLSLQEKLRGATLVCQSANEQNVQLQLSLQQQQAMVTESAARVSELEESQSQLQTEVSSLEQQLERVRASLRDQVGSREQDVQEKDQELQEVNRQNAQLSGSVSHLATEMTKCRGELVTKELELKRLRRDVNIKASQISRMEESFHCMKEELDSKTERAVDLEDALHRCETDKLNNMKCVQMLEGQLQAVRGELADTLEQLQELRDVLQRTQTIADDRQTSVDKLTVQLSETRRELEERTHEVLDMDTALKERQGELQQRAKLLGQLEVAIREHKQEMARKVASLQQSLEVRERELRDAQQELADRNSKESRELGEQLSVSQQRLHNLQRELEEMQRRCEALTKELDASKLHFEEKGAQLSRLEEGLARNVVERLQSEAALRSTAAALEQELELQREEHSSEVESLQQSRGQLLKVSEQISSTMRSTQESLTSKLQQSQSRVQQAEAQLEQTQRELDRSRNQVTRLQMQWEETQAQLLQTRSQLEQSRLLAEQVRAQNLLLHTRLEQVSAELGEARVQSGQLQTQLQASERSVEASSESLLLKESEVTRLQARISSLERAADRHHHTLSLPALLPPRLPHSPHLPPSARSTPSSPKGALSPDPIGPLLLLSPPHPPAATSHLQPPHPPNQTCSWSLADSSLDLPESVKATLREALSKQPWESSSTSLSASSSVEQSWQGLSALEASAASDLSFNPLTYMTDGKLRAKEGVLEQANESRRESVSTLVGQEEVEDMSTLTGMLRFVNQTLAKQEDPSLWSSTGLQESGHGRPLQVTTCSVLSYTA